MNLEEILREVLILVKIAGKILTKFFYYQDFKVYIKKEIELVTDVDFEIEDFLRKNIRRLTPDFNIIGEENFKNEEITEKYYWLIDPLDGTVNFIHRVPWVSISIALMDEKSPVLGVVYNPLSKECFYAVKNKGAYLNGLPIKVSEKEKIEKALLCTSFPGDCKKKGFEKCFLLFKEFNLISQGVRRFGSAALDLAYVACGKYDGFWEPYLKPWDTAAGMLLVKEAGGLVTDYFGNSYNPFLNTIVASNGLLHQELIKYTSKYHPEFLK
ncbi:MAG: inositol monophosphatase [Thermodesulfobacterium sp.]|nr:inositol monophosphatase [Thermodesulfobacterium sp.]